MMTATLDEFWLRGVSRPAAVSEWLGFCVQVCHRTDLFWVWIRLERRLQLPTAYHIRGVERIAVKRMLCTLGFGEIFGKVEA